MTTRTAKRTGLGPTKAKGPGPAKANGPGPEKAAKSASTIRPIADRVLIQALENEKSRNGIIIPDTATEKPQEGRVIALGPGRVTDNGKRIEPGVGKGDRVLYGRYSGTEVKIDGAEYLILRESDILAIL
jgi:chaperonin GroES